MSIYDLKTKSLTDYGFKDPVIKKDISPLKAGVKNMKTKVKETIKIEDGKHEGKIKEIIYKDKPYEYVYIVITESNLDMDLKCGVPNHLTDNSALGIILKNFGVVLEVDKEIEIDDILKEETKVVFQTITEETPKGKFAKIIPSSLKPE